VTLFGTERRLDLLRVHPARVGGKDPESASANDLDAVREDRAVE
jgi:hypothetical protein